MTLSELLHHPSWHGVNLCAMLRSGDSTFLSWWIRADSLVVPSQASAYVLNHVHVYVHVHEYVHLCIRARFHDTEWISAPGFMHCVNISTRFHVTDLTSAPTFMSLRESLGQVSWHWVNLWARFHDTKWISTPSFRHWGNLYTRFKGTEWISLPGLITLREF